jgi:hypothetical protein
MGKPGILVAVLLVMGLVITASCGASSEKSQGVSTFLPAEAGGAPQEIGRDSEELPSGDADRKIVRSGEMALTVDDVLATRDEITRLAAGLDGFIVSSRIWGEEQDIRGSITIRVAAQDFELALSRLREMAVKVKSETTSSQDVTEEYIDLTSRLRNAEATEAQYLELLKQAEDVDDILRVYEGLSRVRSEIEQIKGRVQYLERTTSMSLITVYLEPWVSGRPLVGSGWNPLETIKSAVRGIVGFAEWFTTFFIWLVVFSPVWGGVVAVIYWLRRRRRKTTV